MTSRAEEIAGPAEGGVAQRKAIGEPDGVGDHLGWEAMSMEVAGAVRHRGIGQGVAAGTDRPHLSRPRYVVEAIAR